MVANRMRGSMPAKKETPDDTYRGRFANRLHELRAGRDVPKIVKALAKAGCKISRATYYNWESAASEPPFSALPAIAKVLGVKSIADLFPND
jgi:transcriptional regulator with XRE-family HTH domain